MANYTPPVNNRATQHDGTESLAINDSIARRFLSLLALKIGSRFSPSWHPCVPVSKHLIIKTGLSLHLTEAATLKFVAEETSLPVPHVHCAFVHNNRAIIVI
ncbi:hypothetical protein C8A03DRAFT_37976, partial [Achaetomium macrosporum]